MKLIHFPLLALLVMILPLAAHAAPVALPSPVAPTAADLAELFLPSIFAQPKLSPNGDYLGFMARRGDLFAIGVYDFATRKMTFKGGGPKIIPTDFWWKTPTRLLVRTTSDKYDARGYTSFEADGSAVRDEWRLSEGGGTLYDSLPTDPRHVLMLRHRNIVKVNLENNNEETITQQLNHVSQWIVDESGQPRAAMQRDWQHGEIDVWWNRMAGGPWQVRTFKAKESQFFPKAVGTDPRFLLGWEFSPDDDLTLSRFDTTTGAVESLPRITGRDPTSLIMLGRTRKPIAIAYEQGATMQLVALTKADAPGIARLQKHFTGYLVEIIDTMPDGKNWLVWVGNSRMPGAYILYNHETDGAFVLAFSHDQKLTEDRFAAGEYFTFNTRSGSALSARLWRPRNNPQPPLIIICPEELPAAIVWDLYDPFFQALVKQGFAVLQVNVSNSWGFGKAGRHRPREEWIGKLQEDLEDATQTLVRQQLVDPTHLNLYGVDFGGVLALQVAARSRLFSAVATINTPREVHRDDLSKLSLAAGANPLATKFGGWSESEKFAESLSPIHIVPTLAIPALYLHNEEGSFKGRLTEDGRAIATAAKRAKVPGESGLAYTWSDYPKLPSQLALEKAEIAGKVAAFFHQTAARAAN